MGTLKKGILGGFSGRVGPAVGSSWKGLDVIRSRPPLKRKRSTEAQLRQMARMNLVSGFLSQLTGLLNDHYDRGLSNMSAFNRAVSLNMRNGIDGTHPEFTIAYDRVVLGTDDLLNPELAEAKTDSRGQISLIWKDNSFTGSARATDQAFAAVYCPEMKDWRIFERGTQRNAGRYLLEIPAFSGKTVHAYIGFISDNGRSVSTSQYAGLLNVL
jgi:hypothetical protein